MSKTTSPERDRPQLNEKRIKCLLLDSLEGKYRAKMIGVEVPFLAGQRWADLLLITGQGELIAFEIKSDHDSLRRLATQIEDYTQTFDQVRLVLSEKFKNSPLLRALPRAVGIEFVDGARRRIKCSRRARVRTRLSKRHLLFFLWEKDLAKFRRSKQDSVQEMRNRMERACTLETIKKCAVVALVGRYRGRYKTYLREKSKRVQEEDLSFLTKTSWNTL